MFRLLALLTLTIATLQASMVTGIHYAQIEHKASFDGAGSGENKAWGPGFMLGYDAQSFRIVAMRSTPDFKDPQEATLTTLSAHLIDHEDAHLRGFLGLALGNLEYRHPEQSSSQTMDLYGLEVGLIFLDDRFERTQMEIGYRYLKTYGDLPSGLKLDALSSFYIGFNFHLF